MLFFNFRVPRLKAVVVLLAVAAIVTTLLVLKFEREEEPSREAAYINSEFSVVDYITSFGPEVDVTVCRVDEITVPTEFSEVYISYNNIQKLQGFDLEKYKGKTLTRYTYPVTNYPDTNLSVFAEVLVFEEMIVAADIYSTDSDGFIMALK